MLLSSLALSALLAGGYLRWSRASAEHRARVLRANRASTRYALSGGAR